MIQRDVLFQVLDALDALNIPYMVVGSFASNLWGRPSGKQRWHPPTETPVGVELLR